MSLANLSRHYERMRQERDDAVGEYHFLEELIAGHILDNSPGALTFLTVVAQEQRKAEKAAEQKAA
jgi:hypothetical protein